MGNRTRGSTCSLRHISKSLGRPSSLVGCPSSCPRRTSSGTQFITNTTATTNPGSIGKSRLRSFCTTPTMSNHLYIAETPAEVSQAKGLHLLTQNTPNGQATQIMLEELHDAYGTEWGTTLINISTNVQKEDGSCVSTRTVGSRRSSTTPSPRRSRSSRPRPRC